MAVRKAAVLGSPIEHSKSPQLHLAAYAKLGLDWEYDRQEIRQDQLIGFVEQLENPGGESWAGLSLTMPLKEEALRLSSSASEVARKTGSANTLIRRDGGWFADNTDVAGLIYAFEQGGVGAESLKTATVLGTGATARSSVAALVELSPGAEVRIAGRTPANVERIVSWARQELDAKVVGFGLDDDNQNLFDVDIVVSTIPAEAINQLAALDPRLDVSPGLLVDVVYDPPSNELAEAWVKQGGRRIGGLTMLVGQAAEQVRLMTGYDGPLEPIRQAMLEAVAP